MIWSNRPKISFVVLRSGITMHINAY